MLAETTTTFDREALLDDVVTAYLKEAGTGSTPTPAAWLDRYPELAADLAEFFTDRAALERLAAPLRTVATPTSFGDYEVLEEIARGGMGVVYKARQISLNRVVALKMILPGGRPAADIERFLHTEAKAVASLDHPNIVPIHEIGQHGGRPYFSMKFIDGVDLRRLFSGDSENRRAPAVLRTVAKQLASVARAVHHAHQRGILHRDLKPSNILIDRHGQAHVADFGLAKRVEGDSATTQLGQIEGTPSYMAPEQAAAAPTLTTAVDVYAIGAILYELLTGQPPFRGDTPLDTILRKVRSQEPPRPRSLNPKADRDLETICLKCLAKDPARRYGSAEALADDLERWLGGELIRARRAGSWERTVKWARRRPALAALAGSVACFVGCLVGVALWGWQNADGRATAEEKLRNEEAARATEAIRKTQLVETNLALERAMNHCQRDEVAQGLLWLARGLEVMPEDETELQHSFRRLLAGWSQQVHPLKQVLPIGKPTWLSPNGKVIAEWLGNPPGAVQLRHADTGKSLGKPIPQPGVPNYVNFPSSMIFSPDSKLFASACFEEPTKHYVVRFWDVATQQPVGTPVRLTRARENSLNQVAFSPDSKQLVTLHDYNRDEFGVRLWEVPTGKPVGDPLPTKYVRAVVFSPDSKTLLTAGGKVEELPHEVRLWNTETGKPIGKPVELSFAVSAADFSPDGKTIVAGGVLFSKDITADLPGSMQIIETAPGNSRFGEQIRLPKGVTRVVFGPDGKKILAGYLSYLHSTGEGGLHYQLVRVDPDPSHHMVFIGPSIEGADAGFAFSPNGKTVLLLDRQKKPRLWDTATAKPIGDFLRRAGGDRYWIRLDPDGQMMLPDTAGSVCRWQVARAPTGRKFDAPPDAFFGDATFSPDGKTVAATTRTKDRSELTFWDPATARLVGQPMPLGQANGGVRHVAYSPDGKVKVLLTVDGATVRLWDAATQKLIGVIGDLASVKGRSLANGLALSADSRRVLLAEGGAARQWDIATGKPAGKSLVHKGQIWAVAFSPDGKRIVTGGDDQTARVWDAETGEPIGEALKHPATVDCVAFSPDGKTLLTNAADTARLWNVKTGQPIGEPFRHATQADYSPLKFSPDSKTVLSAGGSGTIKVRLWDAETGKPRGPYLRGVQGNPAFSPDGKTIVGHAYGYAGWDGGSQLYDALTIQPIGKSLPGAYFAAFSPDSRTLLIKDRPGFPSIGETLHLFDVPQPLPGEPARLRVWVEVITGRELDAGGEVADLDATAWQERRDRLQKLGGPP